MLMTKRAGQTNHQHCRNLIREAVGEMIAVVLHAHSCALIGSTNSVAFTPI